MPPRSHRHELALAGSVALHGLLLLFLWRHARPLTFAAPRAGRAVSFDIEPSGAGTGRAPPPATAIVANPPLLMGAARGLPKPPHHAARRRVQSQDTVPERAAAERGIPVIHGIERAAHEAEAPQLEDDDADPADATAPADDQRPGPATAPSSPAGAPLPGAVGVGAPGGAAALWGAAAGALAGGGGTIEAPAPPRPPPDDRATLAAIQARLAARAPACYPAAARRLGITGTAEIRFCVAHGAATAVQVERGSGDAMLDRAARECVVEGAGPLPALDRCLTVPIEFKQR